MKIFGAGLIAVAVIVGFVFFIKRGDHLSPKGSVLKARTLELNETTSLLALDVRIVNDSNVTMAVRSICMSVKVTDGRTVDGIVLSKAELKSTFDYFPLLGERYNDFLGARDQLPPNTNSDRMVAASFAVPLSELDARKQVTVRIEDVTGAAAEFSGK